MSAVTQESIILDVTAVLSMLHEPADANSATRRFRLEPVLSWTLRRLERAERLNAKAILCWEDQLEAVQPIADEHRAYVLAKGPRTSVPPLDAVSAAQRWADGWRGGLLSTCEFDRGFYGPWVQELLQRVGCDTVVLVDPASGLVDPALIDRLIEHAYVKRNQELIFSQAAPGLGGALVRGALVNGLAQARSHPGRILHYIPEQPVRDPIGSEACLPVATPVARSCRSFKLDSDRQVRRLGEASISLNGELFASEAEELVRRMEWSRDVDDLPREVVLELTTRRATSPIFWPGRTLDVRRPELSEDVAARIFDELAEADDLRLTLAGCGDPLLHPKLLPILARAREAGIHAIHLETDLLPEDPGTLAKLAQAGVDVVSFHLPAMTPSTYAAVMGVDRFSQVLANVATLARARHATHAGTPLLAPLFVKTAANLAEMENWYDQWLGANGSAVILGPSDCAGQIPYVGLADMAPPRRGACARLQSRMTILSDGRVVPCEQDVLGRNAIGVAGQQALRELWKVAMNPLRLAHGKEQWDAQPLCRSCKDWHRP